MMVYCSVVMIGDGATDLEACPPAVSIMSSIAIYLLIQILLIKNSCGKNFGRLVPKIGLVEKT